YGTVWRELVTFDLAIIPWDMRRWAINDPPLELIRSKSANRLTQLMATGLPVIASPVPSYIPIIEQGVNGFIASNRQEWERCFELLRDPVTRERIGRNARKAVLERYSADAQADLLAMLFNELLLNRDVL